MTDTIQTAYYPVLVSELAVKKISVMDISRETGIPYSTLAPKIRGEKPVTVSEGRKIRDAIKSELSLEELFKEAE